jgi:hypothetical protein
MNLVLRKYDTMKKIYYLLRVRVVAIANRVNAY